MIRRHLHVFNNETTRSRQPRRLGRVTTSLDAANPVLRGRTYAIPFDTVWSAALDVVTRLPGWVLTGADDHDGVIEFERRARMGRKERGGRVWICLDPHGQTRVDLRIDTPRLADLLRAPRLSTTTVARFLNRLDTAVGAGPGLILDSSRPGGSAPRDTGIASVSGAAG